jgi:uncharacterized protein YigE (DUF2233 family)
MLKTIKKNHLVIIITYLFVYIISGFTGNINNQYSNSKIQNDSLLQNKFQYWVDSCQSIISEYNQFSFYKENSIIKKDSLELAYSKDTAFINTQEQNITNVISNYCLSDITARAQLLPGIKKKLKEHYSTLSPIEQKSIEIKLKHIPEAEKDLKEIDKKLNTLSPSFTQAIKLFETALESDSFPDNFSLSYKNVTYRIVIANALTNDIQIHNNNSGKAQTLNAVWKQLQKEGSKPIAVLNGGMFKEDYLPQGLLIQNYKIVSPMDVKTDKMSGNFYLYPNGVFFIDSMNNAFVSESRKFIEKYSPKNYTNIKYATQSGPLLLINGKVHRAFAYNSKNVNIRNGVGIRDVGKNKKMVFVISDQPVNFYDFAIVFKDILGCNNALYLDGAISMMYVENQNKKSGNLGGSFGPVISISKKK